MRGGDLTLGAPVLSIVIPAHNEALHLESSLHAIGVSVSAIGAAYEIVVVDDGSTDGSWALLECLAATDRRVHAIRLSRRFGKEAAICAGLTQARGEAIVVMDSDLQHPPSLVHEMYRLWREDEYDVIEAVTVARDRGSLVPSLGSRLFYRLFRRLSSIPLENATDFKLMDRRVIDAWARLPERTLFFRGMSAWTGFRRREIPLAVPHRTAGSSRWSSLQLLALAVDGITSFSAVPVYLITLMGVGFLLFGGALALLALYYKVTGASLEGFPTVIIVQVILGSVLLISLGIIGQYIAKIYDEVKARPRFIVAESTDLPAASRRAAHAADAAALHGGLPR